jgi:NTP pyrophosphatase (non-canonical NTP hydrolase)
MRNILNEIKDIELYYFGLGFIKARVSDYTSYHFYHPDLPPITEDPHNHRSDFISEVITGSIVQQHYSFEPNASGAVKRIPVNCGTDYDVSNIPIVKGNLTHTSSTIHSTGTSYKLTSNKIHSVKAVGKCITKITKTKGPTEYTFAYSDGDLVCPYSERYSQAYLRRLVLDCLTLDCLGAGYHKNLIDKGELGEFSKIVEEVQELQDAIEQGSTVMIGVELSDLYGAIELFAKQYNLSMDDLKLFSDITQRAFKNGHRL